MLPSLATKENPSPLFKVMSFPENFRDISDLDLFVPVTTPISSPMDFAASIDAHFPRFPSMKSSVYPLLNVLRVSGVNPPVT